MSQLALPEFLSSVLSSNGEEKEILVSLMREQNLRYLTNLTEKEKYSLYETLDPLPPKIIEEVIALSNYERQVILTTFPSCREPEKYFLDFVTSTNQMYRPEPAHALICDTLDNVISRKITRLIIVAPPQHGKSELASVRFPAFFLGKRPNDPVIITSYGASLAEDKSAKVRDIIGSDEYKLIFPKISIKDDSRAKALWKLSLPYTAQIVAAGLDGPITGQGALLGLIDDPFSSWEDAISQNTRDKVWNWYRGTFRTRIWENGTIVIIMTRWHPDDLIGRLAKEPNWHEWVVVRLPAIAETQEERNRNNRLYNLPADLPEPLERQPGEALTPSRYSSKALKEIKSDVGTLVWNAEYQGAPKPEEGNLIKRVWFNKKVSLESIMFHDKFPIIRYWDKAGTDGGGDWTVGVLMAYDYVADYFYILDVARAQKSLFGRDAFIKEIADSDLLRYNEFGLYSIKHEQERSGAGKDSAAILNKSMNGYPISADPPNANKRIRATPFIKKLEQGRVFLVNGTWNDDYIDEVCDFPFGNHDDQVDGSSGAFNNLALFQPNIINAVAY